MFLLKFDFFFIKIFKIDIVDLNSEKNIKIEDCK